MKLDLLCHLLFIPLVGPTESLAIKYQLLRNVADTIHCYTVHRLPQQGQY